MESVSSFFYTVVSMLKSEPIIASIAYAGLFLTIYYANRVQHKSIRYLAAKKNDEFIILFWNSCKKPIMREDMFFFNIYSNRNTECNSVFASDSDIPLIVQASDFFVTNKKEYDILLSAKTRRLACSFDFLNKREGYILRLIQNEIQSADESGAPVKKPGSTTLIIRIKGRIRGESKKSIKYAMGSALRSGIRAMQRRRPRGFWNICSGRKECGRYTLLSLPGMTLPAV